MQVSPYAVMFVHCCIFLVFLAHVFAHICTSEASMGDTCLLVFVPFFQKAGATSAHICTSEASMSDTCLLVLAHFFKKQVLQVEGRFLLFSSSPVQLSLSSCNLSLAMHVHASVCACTFALFSALLHTYLLIFAQARLQWVTPVCLLYPKLHYMQHLLLEIEWSACEHL